MKNKILICVDCQNDFIDGSLAVNGASEKIDNVISFIKEHTGEFSAIILTSDFHPKNHSSFSSEGGIWPAHCVAHTDGAKINNGLLRAVMEERAQTNNEMNWYNLHKGTELKEEYSIMENDFSSKMLLSIIEKHDECDIYICGIANEYCVLNTIKDLANIDNIKNKLIVFKNGVAAISDESVLFNFCDEKKINMI